MQTKLNTTFLLITAVALIGCGGGYAGGGPGPKGDQGIQGVSGDSCSVTQLPDGALIECEDGSTAFVENGEDGAQGEQGVPGQDGQDGQDATLPDDVFVSSIDPCGGGPGHDEILLITQGGDYVAYFAGAGGFLTILECNTSYVTTDNQACQFRLNADCEYEEL